ncbi:glycosyltransferase [Ideonella livida]|uniref:Glycosyltransferase n=1 Tax=Ideonella livida TaxID=2707176 RepID=A0A7C9TLA5_9BURK|nr:glycosyltransferase [Ideonella livida]NDY93399.1 glycosyltransferase [Ideonella livida]
MNPSATVAAAGAASQVSENTPPVALAGGVEYLYTRRLVGWATGPVAAGETLEVELLSDGVPVARAPVAQLRTDRPDPATGMATATGWEITLSPAVMDGKVHTLSLRRLSDGAPIEGSAKALLLPKGERSKPVEGHIDGFRGFMVGGWAFDPEYPEQPLDVELHCDGVAVARSRADVFRADLAKLGKNNGRAAFALRVPPHLYDGKGRVLTVVEARGGSPLKGATLELPHTRFQGAIEGTSGAAVQGWVQVVGNSTGGMAVELWIDGDLASSGHADQPREGGEGVRFHIGLPDKYLDGRVHELSLTSPDYPGIELAANAILLPCHLTPADALQRYAGFRYLRSYVSPLGPRRYESLRRGIADLASAAAEASSEADLRAICRDLVSLSHGQEQVIRSFISPVQRFTPLHFVPHATPDVSIVIPAHNKFATTYNCLASIAAARCQATYEVIVVDDGSKDETLDLPTIAPNVKVVRHEEAKGFVGASNAGGAAATGRYVVMLNNDTEVMAGWLDELLDPFTRFEGVGMTGAKLIYPDGKLQEAGGLIWANGQPWNIGRNGNPDDPRYNYTRQVDYISGACVMLPMTLWKELAGFDTYFAPAYYEDTDLAFRVRAKGFKTVYTPFCEVVHYEGVSNGTSTSGSGLKRFQAINEPKFKQRWTHAYRHNGKLGQDAPHVMQDRGVTHRVLVFDAQTLTPDLDAGSYSATQEIRILQSLGFKVTFVPANMAYMGGYTEALQRMGVEVLYAPFYFSMAEVVERRGKEFDLFYVARYGVAEQVVKTIRAQCPQTPIILNIHDLHFLREIREALQRKDMSHMNRATATRDAELAVMREVDLAITYSKVEEAVIVSHNLTSTRTGHCPWVVETATQVPPFAQREGIAFLGGFGHSPNVEAVEWFCRDVMPLLRARLPGVPFLIYGSKAPDSLKKLEDEDIVLKGFARTTEEVYDTARVFVAPLLTGAGLKGKVIGAFARGIPTVMTPTAAEGTGARHGLDAFVCTEPAEWVDALVKLYSDEAAWNAMSASARHLTQVEYSLEAGRKTLKEALHQVNVFPESDCHALWPLKLEL